MTSTEEKTEKQENPGKQGRIKSAVYGFISELGEYFIWVFVRMARFIGLCFMYLFAIVYEPLMNAKEPVSKFFSNIGNALAAPFRRRKRVVQIGKAQVNSARERHGVWGAVVARVKIVWRVFFGKRGWLATVVNWALPVMCCVFFVNIVSYANSQNYALKLYVNGDFIGYISDDSLFVEAEKMVQNRINYTGSTTEVITFEPVYEVENIGSSSLLNQYQVADKMLRQLGKDVKDGYGLYLGDTYYGTLTSHEKLDEAMSELLAKYATGVAGEKVEFDKQITYINGTYLADSFVEENYIIRLFTGSTKPAAYHIVKEEDTLDSVLSQYGLTKKRFTELNPEFDEDNFSGGVRYKVAAETPFRTVIVTCEEHYSEEFAFDTEYVNDALLYTGNKAIKQAGENGEYAVVADVSYINGAEVSRKVLSRLVTKESVTECIAIGTKPRPANTAPGQTIGAGLFLWPVGGVDGGIIGEAVYWMGGYAGHRGIDILDAQGTPVYAAHNGVVKAASYGWNGDSRGNYVIIQGDDGYTTYYYHNIELCVSAGQRVTAGDLIAYVGMTGMATGNHLHFGVSVGDTYLDPMDYLPYHQMSPHVAAYYPNKVPG